MRYLILSLLTAAAAFAQPAVDYPRQVKRPPALDIRTYQFTLKPGGSVAIGANTATLVPCPLGVNGSDVNHYVYLSGGSGTAEAVLITGGTCTSGAASGTILFTAANAHAGSWAVSSAGAGIPEAISALPSNGGRIVMPSGALNIRQTITVGAGTNTTRSLVNSIELVGQGSGRSDDLAFPTDAGTQLLWGGPAGGTMLVVRGPVGNVLLEDFDLNANASAAIGLDIIHSYNSTYRRMNVWNWTSLGVRSQAVDFVFSSMVDGNNGNLFESIHSYSSTGNSSSVAGQFGQAAANVHSIFDFASNTFLNSSFRHDLGTAIELRYADNNSFLMTSMTSASGSALKLSQPGSSGFPAANVFFQSPVIGAVSGAAYDSAGANLFLPFSDTDVPVDPSTLQRSMAGVDSFGKWFGVHIELGTYDASGAVSTIPFKSGTSLPASCTVGMVFYKTNATAGQNFYGCTSTNTWTAEGGSGGGGDVSSNTSSSVDGEISLFSGTGGKTIKRATGSGVATVASGVLGTVAGSAGDCVHVDATSAPCLTATYPAGVEVGDGTSTLVGVAAANQLSYLRRQANTGAASYVFAPLADLIAGDYDWLQTPGGSISVGSNSITLTPCPLGVAGADAHHYVYLSSGTGTAEAAIITGGTCTSGASSGTIIVTAANTHSGAFTVGSASAGLKEAVNMLPSAGGRIRLPTAYGVTRNIYQTVYVGNGSTSGPSTLNNVEIIGDGGGSSDSESNPQTAGTILYWAGPVGGTILDAEGPIAGLRIQGLFVQCDGMSRAATGLLANHAYNSVFSDLTFNGCSSWAIKHYAYNNPTGMAVGANNNQWDSIRIFPSGSATASGIQIGGTSGTGNALDVAQNHYRNLSVFSGGSGTCMELRYTDASTFENFNCGGSGGTPPLVGLKVTESVALFPQSIVCINCSIVATTVLDDSGWTASNPVAGGWFLAWNNDAEVTDPNGTHGWSGGYSTAGRFWGKWKSTPEIYQSIAASTAIASTASETAFSKTFTVPGYSLQRAGTRIRVTASGKFSTTGTPTLLVALKYGTSGVSGNTFAAIPATTTVNNTSNFGWTIVGELVMRTAVGAASSFTNGACNGGLQGVNQQSCTYPNTFTLNTVADQTVTVTAQWGTSDAANTTTLETLGVEILVGGQAN